MVLVESGKIKQLVDADESVAFFDSWKPYAIIWRGSQTG